MRSQQPLAAAAGSPVVAVRDTKDRGEPALTFTPGT